MDGIKDKKYIDLVNNIIKNKKGEIVVPSYQDRVIEPIIKFLQKNSITIKVLDNVPDYDYTTIRCFPK